jgi:hypothetical protein
MEGQIIPQCSSLRPGVRVPSEAGLGPGVIRTPVVPFDSKQWPIFFWHT